jgi:hypothetical protein
MEKQGYRETISFLVDMFPDRAALSVSETAKALGVAGSTVYNSMGRVKHPIPHKKIGGKIIVPISLLAKWMCDEEKRSYAR